MASGRCAACGRCGAMDRRAFLAGASASLAAAAVASRLDAAPAEQNGRIRQCGPASRCVPKVKACFVRRKEPYGMRWPGQIYDGEAARRTYIRKTREAAAKLNVELDLNEQPIYSAEEADRWVAEAADQRPDGLLVILLDRQRHAWPTAAKVIDSGLPTVVFSPIGTAFTTNTSGLAQKTGCFICSTDDFREVEFGLKMLQAGARMRATRCLVIKGGKRDETVMGGLGISLRYVPAQAFKELYLATPVDDEIRALAADLIRNSTGLVDATEQDVLNGVRSYVVARKMLQREEADAITMDCLGALGKTDISLPCIAWSKMNDDAIPAACEADRGAVASHVVTQYLFDRPGFQQDPVPETAREAIVGAHCTCATRLRGFSEPREPYDIRHHHGVRDATTRPVWKEGQRVTSVDVLPAQAGQPPKMLISAGCVLENVSVPPAGGCVVSVMVKFDGVSDVLGYPGFHQVWFYGDFKKRLLQFCKLFRIEPVVV